MGRRRSDNAPWEEENELGKWEESDGLAFFFFVTYTPHTSILSLVNSWPFFFSSQLWSNIG